MRPVTKRAIYVILGVVVLLLALGALPGLLRSGDPYYVTATPADGVPGDNGTAFNATTIPENRYPYTTAALDRASPDAPGRSDPYWKGPFGIKGAFTHSPFDERAALRRQHPNASVGGALYVRHGGTVYRLAIVQEGGG